jgi:hypothetical protein
MSAGEDQPQPVAADRTQGRGWLVIENHHCFSVFAIALVLAADQVDCHEHHSSPWPDPREK